MFVDFYGVNIRTMVDFNLPTPRMQSWGEMHKIGLYEPG